MSGTGWELSEDSGSSSHLRRVVISAPTRSQAAYRKYISHAAGCLLCAKRQCERSAELWQAYEEARDGLPPRER